jgi:hypothetical protein
VSRPFDAGEVEQLSLFAGEAFRHPAELWPCKACGGMPLPDRNLRNQSTFVWTYLGADPCLGWLAGVRAACCGHGEARLNSDPYLILQDGRRLDGSAALAKMRELGGNPP